MRRGQPVPPYQPRPRVDPAEWAAFMAESGLDRVLAWLEVQAAELAELFRERET